MGQIMYQQIAVENELKTKNELRDKGLAESANSWQASPIFSYNSLTVWNLLSDAIPLVHDLAHDQGNIATFRTPITFEFQSTHIEFAWRSTSTTYMFLLLAQISNLFSRNILPLWLLFSCSHEIMRNWGILIRIKEFLDEIFEATKLFQIKRGEILTFLLRISHFSISLVITWEKKMIGLIINIFLVKLI